MIAWKKSDVVRWFKEDLNRIQADRDAAGSASIVKSMYTANAEVARSRYYLGARLLRMQKAGFVDPPRDHPCYEALYNPGDYKPRYLLERIFKIVRDPQYNKDYFDAVGNIPQEVDKIVERHEQRMQANPYERYLFDEPSEGEVAFAKKEFEIRGFDPD